MVNYVCHHVSVRIPARASETLEAPWLWWFMYIEPELACSQSLLGSLTGGLQMVLLWSIWAVAENGASNSQSHLQMRHSGFEASCHRAKIEIGAGSRHEMGSGDLPLTTHTHTQVYECTH